MLDGFSIDLWPGEIIGIAGLEGMGQRDLFFSLFGMTTPTSGTILVGGKSVTLKSPRDAIRKDIGISLVP